MSRHERWPVVRSREQAVAILMRHIPEPPQTEEPEITRNVRGDGHIAQMPSLHQMDRDYDEDHGQD